MKVYLIALTVFGLITCTSQDKKIPRDVIAVDKMKIVVWNLMEAGSYASVLKEKDTSIKKINTAYLSQVLKLHGISKEKFFRSFDFYQAHPELNDQLFDSINAYAQRRRNYLYKKAE